MSEKEEIIEPIINKRSLDWMGDPLILMRDINKEIYIDKIKGFKTFNNNGAPISINSILDLRNKIELIYESINEDAIKYQKIINKMNLEYYISTGFTGYDDITVLIFKIEKSKEDNCYRVVYTNDVTSFHEAKEFGFKCLFEGTVLNRYQEEIEDLLEPFKIGKNHIIDKHNLNIITRDIKDFIYKSEN